MNRRATIIKTFRFEAGHVLTHHRGKCSRPHGHNYRVDVELYGPINADEFEGQRPSHYGMVVDFYDVTEAWREHIHAIVDHQMLNDVLFDAAKRPVYPTAENIAWWILDQLVPVLPDVVAVTVWETDDARARVERDSDE